MGSGTDQCENAGCRTRMPCCAPCRPRSCNEGSRLEQQRHAIKASPGRVVTKFWRFLRGPLNGRPPSHVSKACFRKPSRRTAVSTPASETLLGRSCRGTADRHRLAQGPLHSNSKPLVPHSNMRNNRRRGLHSNKPALPRNRSKQRTRRSSRLRGQLRSNNGRRRSKRRGGQSRATTAPGAGTGSESRTTTAAGPGTDESGPKAGEYDRRVDRVTLDEIKVPVANDPTRPTYQCIWAATFGPGERSPPSSGY